MGAEWAFAPRWTAFGEWAKSGDEKLTHAGVRWWLKRERYALDLSALRRQPEGGRSTTGWVLNFSVYDLLRPSDGCGAAMRPRAPGGPGATRSASVSGLVSIHVSGFEPRR